MLLMSISISLGLDSHFLLPAEGWEVYKRGCLLVSLLVSVSQKTMKALRDYVSDFSGHSF